MVPIGCEHLQFVSKVVYSSAKYIDLVTKVAIELADKAKASAMFWREVLIRGHHRDQLGFCRVEGLEVVPAHRVGEQGAVFAPGANVPGQPNLAEQSPRMRRLPIGGEDRSELA